MLCYTCSRKCLVISMPASCVVGGCSRNAKKNPNVHFLAFPNATKDPATRREWKRFVNNTRSDFQLTSSSLICSSHFDTTCQDESTKLQGQFGLKIKFRLKPGSVPTLKAPFAYSVKATAATDTVPPALAGGNKPSLNSPLTKRRKRSGLAFEKRERARVLLEAEQMYDANLCGDTESTDSAQSSPMEQVEDEYSEQFGDESEPKIMDDADSGDQDPSNTPSTSRHPNLTINQNVVHDSYLPPTSRKTFYRSKETQTIPKRFPVSLRHKGVQSRRPFVYSGGILSELVEATKLQQNGGLAQMDETAKESDSFSEEA